MEYAERHLTEQDRTKLKAERRKGYIVGFCTSLVGLAIMAICYLFGARLVVVYCLIGLALLAGLAVGMLVNRQVNADLRYGRKHVYVKEIKGIKSLKAEYSKWTLALPWKGSYHMDGHYLTAGNLDYPITDAEREALEGQTHCELHYAPRSFVLLGVRSSVECRV